MRGSRNFSDRRVHHYIRVVMGGSIPETFLRFTSIKNRLLQGFIGKKDHFWHCKDIKALLKIEKSDSAGG